MIYILIFYTVYTYIKDPEKGKLMFKELLAKVSRKKN